MAYRLLPNPEVLSVGERITYPTVMTKTAVFVSFNFKRAIEVIRLVSVLDDEKHSKKRFWSIYGNFDSELNSLLRPVSSLRPKAGAPTRPYWQDFASSPADEAFLSRKQLNAIRDEVANALDTVVDIPPASVDGNVRCSLYTAPDIDHAPFVLYYADSAPRDLSEDEVRRIELAIRRAVEKRVRRIRRFTFRRDRASLRWDDAIRVDVFSYRVRTGVSPPEMEPRWATLSSNQALDPISMENNNVSVRRQADRRRFQRTAREGCARKRRAPSRQTNRHSTRSHEARRLPNRRSWTHRQAPQHRAADLLLQY